MTRRRATALTALTLAAGVALAGCGSSKQLTTTQVMAQDPGTSAANPPSSAPPPAAPSPSFAAAAAVPAVTGRQGSKPTIAKGTAPAPTTLLARDVIPGTGPALTSGDSAMANYTLALYPTGTLVQSSYDGGGPFSFSVPGQVIPGFAAGVVGMKVGGRRELVIPAALGYGANPPPGSGIPANATLIFVVDLVKVSPGS